MTCCLMKCLAVFLWFFPAGVLYEVQVRLPRLLGRWDSSIQSTGDLWRHVGDAVSRHVIHDLISQGLQE